MVEPGISRVDINPDGETTTLNQSFVIVLPVADAVPMFGFFGHALRLADVLPPQLFAQQRLAPA
jgi:hypothetical protein